MIRVHGIVGGVRTGAHHSALEVKGGGSTRLIDLDATALDPDHAGRSLRDVFSLHDHFSGLGQRNARLSAPQDNLIIRADSESPAVGFDFNRRPLQWLFDRFAQATDDDWTARVAPFEHQQRRSSDMVGPNLDDRSASDPCAVGLARIIDERDIVAAQAHDRPDHHAKHWCRLVDPRSVDRFDLTGEKLRPRAGFHRIGRRECCGALVHSGLSCV
ncbi:MAG TPA: hypothetical protein VKE96_27295 [Vicinamibacterales bacterium]|nr:hypothetical protein [Vicinamibacterales bacterium]